MSAIQPAHISAHAGSPRTSSSDQRHSDSERSIEGDVDSEKPDIGVENSFAPIKPATTADNTHLQRPHSAASRPIERSWSLNDGYSCNNEADAEANAGGPQGADADDNFTVRWEDNDPNNPRNFNTLKRWMIVIICSMGSLCV